MKYAVACSLLALTLLGGCTFDQFVAGVETKAPQLLQAFACLAPAFSQLANPIEASAAPYLLPANAMFYAATSGTCQQMGGIVKASVVVASTNVVAGPAQ